MTELEKLKKEIVEWHKQTFPDCTLEAQLLKLDEELSEVVEDQRAGKIEESHEELADAYIVALVLAKRYNSMIGKYFVGLAEEHPVPAFVSRVKDKMEINKRRTWHKQNGVYHH
jgi:hypothetical protein